MAGVSKNVRESYKEECKRIAFAHFGISTEWELDLCKLIWQKHCLLNEQENKTM